MRVMLLQGPPSPFARELGAALMARGHHVTRVMLSFGDWLYGRGDGAVLWRGRFAEWEGWVEARMRAEGITHLVYYADRQPHHVAAQRAARRLGLRCVSYENGYLRPDWIVLEEGGQGAFSHFPDDLATVRHLAAGLPQGFETLIQPAKSLLLSQEEAGAMRDAAVAEWQAALAQ